jgi:large subunit ribosomal protein L6
MSRIGKVPIKLPENVKVETQGDKVIVEGPKGSLTTTLRPKMGLSIKEGEIKVVKRVEDEETSNLYGLTRTLVANMVQGVTEGFRKELEINGIGYRASVSGDTLTLSLGYSHPIEYKAPEGIKISVEKNIVIISGIDKQKVGQIAAEIRAFRKPEPYKGKGVRYIDEVVRRKSGKTGAK